MKYASRPLNVEKAVTLQTGASAVFGMPLRLFGLLVLLLLGSLLGGNAQAREIVKFEASHPGSDRQVMLRAELYRPDGQGPFPAVVLMHGCGGWQPAVRYTMSTYAEYLTRHGFAVLNLDSFGPRRLSGGKVCESFRRLADARDYRTQDARDAKRYLQSLDFIDAGNIFLMGQSNGGSVAIRVAASQKDFRAVVAYYPWCGAFGGRDVELSAPLLVLGGAKDDWVPPTYCQSVRTTGADYQVTVYPNAAHSFDLEIIPQRYLGKLIGKDPQAAQDSREKMLAFFQNHLG